MIKRTFLRTIVGAALVGATLSAFPAGVAGAKSAPQGRHDYRPYNSALGAAAPAIANLTYHGGPVMHHVTTFAIYWQPPNSAAQTTFASGYISLINRFFTDVGSTPFWNIMSQYYDTSGPIQNQAAFGGYWVDNNNTPDIGTSTTDGITEKDVRQAVNDALAANPAWGPADNTKEFFVYTPKGVYGDGLGTTYCAYHNSFTDAGGQAAVYAYEPYDATVTNCGSTATTNSNFDADIEISTTSHELSESVTDPYLTGWYNTNTAGENGDQCAYTYGSINADNSNIYLHGNPYIMQEEWSNADDSSPPSQAAGCVKEWQANNVGHAAISGDLNFGTIPRGSTATRAITVQNTGIAPLNVVGASISGASSYVLETSPGVPQQIQPGSSVSYNVDFAPPANSTGGSPTATLTLNTDDPTQQTITLPATGTIGIPVVSITGNLNFGTVPRGTTSSINLTITNAGQAPLTLSGANFTGGDSSFTANLPAPGAYPLTLQPSAHATINVNFSPPANSGSGTRSNTLTVTSDDPSNPSVPLIYTGAVGVPVQAVSGSLLFGTVPRGTTATQVITIQNNGGAPLNVSSVAFDSGAGPDLSVSATPSLPQSIPAGGSTNFSVVFSPPANASAATETGTLRITTDDPANPQATVSAVATIGVPTAVLSPGAILFGAVCKGVTSDQEEAVTNSGYADLTVSGVTLSGPDASQFQIVNPPQPSVLIRPGSYYDFIIRFAPTTAGTKTATLHILSNDPANPDLAVSLSGTGGGGNLVLGASAINFQGTPVDNRTSPHFNDQSLQITNQSDCALTITNLSIGGANPTDFSLISPPATPFTIGAHNGITLTSQFNPTFVGARAAALEIDTDDINHPSALVGLTGTGLLPAITPSVTRIVFPPTVVEPVAAGTGGSSYNLGIINTGQAELIVDAMNIFGTGFFAPAAATPPTRFAPNTGFSEPVTFHPSGSPSREVLGTFTTADNNPEGIVSNTVQLCGEAVGRGIRVLVVNSNGTPYSAISRLQLQSHGITPTQSVSITKPLSLQTIQSCNPIQFHYENQNLPATDSSNQRGSYYDLSVSVGNKSTNVQFSLAVNQFRVLVLVV